jgi:hypothetical protein
MNGHTILRRLLPRLTALATAAVVAAAAAPMYKWVDEKGVTHFSENPPADGKATKIEVKPAAPSTDARQPADNWKERELEFRARRLEKERAEDAGHQRQEREIALRKSRCLTAQRQLDVLRRAIPVYSVNERGERVYIEDKDRPAEIEHWKRAVEANCGR